MRGFFLILIGGVLLYLVLTGKWQQVGQSLGSAIQGNTQTGAVAGGIK